MIDDWCSISDIGREKRIGEEESLRMERPAKVGPLLCRCYLCSAPIDVQPLGPVLMILDHDTMKRHECQPKEPEVRHTPPPRGEGSMTLTIGGKRVVV